MVNSIKKAKRTIILFRVDAHRKFGMGHAFRCLNYAIGLRELLPVEPHFLMLKSSLESGFPDWLKKHDIPLHIVSGENIYREDFCKTEGILKEYRSSIVFTDLLNPDKSDDDLNLDPDLHFPLLAGYIAKLKKTGITVFSITDAMEEIDIGPDVVIAAGNQHPEKFKDNEETKYLTGSAYYVLPADFREFVNKPKTIPERAEKVLVFFGGSDVDGFALKTVEALKKSSFQLNVILGTATPAAELTAEKMLEAGAEVLFNPPKIAKILFEADIAITHGGNTTFELAALGVPLIVISRRERQHHNAVFLQDKGVAVNLGLGFGLNPEIVRNTVEELAGDHEQRSSMSRAGRLLVDGRGLERIAEVARRYLIE